MAKKNTRVKRKKNAAQKVQKERRWPLFALIGAALLAGYMLRGGAGEAQQKPAQSVQSMRHLQPAWSVYEGAKSCTMSADGRSVACDNGYNGPLR